MRKTIRRALVLSQEGAGHPFRRSLPPHVFTVFTVPVCAETENTENEVAARYWRLNGGDWRGFLAAYCASFMAIVIFIA